MLIENRLIAYSLLALLVALVVSFLMTPVVKTFAYKVGAIDVPKDARRMHKTPIPRLGAACDSRGTACRHSRRTARIQRGRAQRLCVILRQSRAGAQDQLRVLPVRRHSRHAVKAAVDHSADRQSVRVKGRAGAPG